MVQKYAYSARWGALFVCFPQMELGQVATTYSPTNGTIVTRAADMAQYDVSFSFFKLYGVRDLLDLREEEGY